MELRTNTFIRVQILQTSFHACTSLKRHWQAYACDSMSNSRSEFEWTPANVWVLHTFTPIQFHSMFHNCWLYYAELPQWHFLSDTILKFVCDLFLVQLICNESKLLNATAKSAFFKVFPLLNYSICRMNLYIYVFRCGKAAQYLCIVLVTFRWNFSAFAALEQSTRKIRIQMISMTFYKCFPSSANME